MSNNKILWIVGMIVVIVAGVFMIYLLSDKSSPPDDSVANSLPAVTPTPASGNLAPASNVQGTNPSVNSEQETKNMQHLITIKTSMGDIQFETYDADAPKAVNNFITLAGKGFYDNVIFHRIIKGFMIQGGDPTGTGRGGPGYAFEDELNPGTPSYQAGYVKGVVAMANSGPNTNGSQFFIMLANTPLPHSYTIFGKVIKGQDVVDAMGALPTDAGDRPSTPPVIKS